MSSAKHAGALQMRSKKDFVHEEDVRAPRRLGWRNVVEGLELHKNLLSPAEEDIFVDAIRRWEEEGRAVRNQGLGLRAQGTALLSRPAMRTQ